MSFVQCPVAAPRKSYLLVDVGAPPTHGACHYAVVELEGLDPDSIKRAAKVLSVSARKTFPHAKHTDWQHGIARGLGAKSYNEWLHTGYPRLEQFLSTNVSRGPADLITWKRAPIWGGSPLTPRAVADRLFAAGRPLPEKIFTGQGSSVFGAVGYGRPELYDAMAKDGIHRASEQAEFEWMQMRENEVVLRVERLTGKPEAESTSVELTARALYIQAMWDQYGPMWNLLGDSIVSPTHHAPVFTLYNAATKDIELAHKRYLAFREEIESTEAGWVDVLPFNECIAILRCRRTSRYDIVFRDQRDKAWTQSPFYPVFSFDELPSSLGEDSLHAALYYKKGLWEAKLRHDAETHYYAAGGLPKNWPGERRLIERYLHDRGQYRPARANGGVSHPLFLRHDLGERNLMVSELISIDKFWSFYDGGWADTRAEKVVADTQPWANLEPLNMYEENRTMPACVTWFDAIAYCKHLEEDLGHPVRLLTVEEWRHIRPKQDVVNATRDWSVERGVEFAGQQSDVYSVGSERPCKFRPDILWLTNRNGLPFLVSPSFGEWLWDYMGKPPNHCFAPAACAATGEAVSMGPLERVGSMVRSTDNHHCHKIGFRLCYEAALDS